MVAVLAFFTLLSFENAKSAQGSMSGPRAVIEVQDRRAVPNSYQTAGFVPSMGISESLYELSGFIKIKLGPNERDSLAVVILEQNYGPNFEMVEGTQWYSNFRMWRLTGKKVSDLFAGPYYGGNLDVHIGIGGGVQAMVSSKGIVITEMRSTYGAIHPATNVRILTLRPINEAHYQKVKDRIFRAPVAAQ